MRNRKRNQDKNKKTQTHLLWRTYLDIFLQFILIDLFSPLWTLKGFAELLGAGVCCSEIDAGWLYGGQYGPVIREFRWAGCLVWQVVPDILRLLSE